MTIKHAVGITLIGATILAIPWAFLVFLTEVMKGSFAVTIFAYLIIIYPIGTRFAEMVAEAMRGADDNE